MTSRRETRFAFGHLVSRRLTVLGAVVAMTAALVAPFEARADGVPTADTQPVVALADGATVGWSTLSRTDAGLSMTLQTTQLPAGEAVTIWWVIFNRPGSCLTHPCGEPDLFNPAAAPSVQHAAGHVIGGAGKGNFGAHLSVGDTSGAWPFYTGPGITDPRAAEVWLVVHQHGPAVPGLVDLMIHSFSGGCANLPPFTGPNVCASTQVGVHVP